MPDAPSVTSEGQTSTTPGTATSQNLAAVGSSHSLAEAVHLGALALLGLIGTEHCRTPPLHRKSGGGNRAATLTRRRAEKASAPQLIKSGAEKSALGLLYIMKKSLSIKIFLRADGAGEAAEKFLLIF